MKIKQLIQENIHKLSRLSILLMAILTSGALIFISWQNYQRAVDAKISITRDRAHALEIAISAQIDDPLNTSDKELAEIIQNTASEELNYLAIYHHGKLISQSGSANFPSFKVSSALSHRFSTQIEDRLVLVTAPFHFRRQMWHHLSELTPSYKFFRNPPGMGIHLVFEFTPTEALSLVGGTVQSISMSILASFILVLTTIIFFYFSIFAEKQEKLESQRKRLAALGEMTAVLGHEIRNPLTSLKGHVMLLQEGLPTSHSSQNSLKMILKETNRLEYLTNHILNFARPTQNNPISFSINELFSETLESLPPDLVVNLDIKENIPNLYGDPIKLKQALINIFLNGQQAAPDMPLECSVSYQQKNIIIKIRDHGPGIAADLQNRLFEPFFTTKTKGTGLGLAIVKSTIEEHKGNIAVSNCLDGGAEFTITLPV